MLIWAKPTTDPVIVEVRKGNKHLRARLDLVREQHRISLVKLYQELPKLLGRTVRDIGCLSDGEMKHVIRQIELGRLE